MRITLEHPWRLIPLALAGLFFFTGLAEHLLPWHQAALLALGGLIGWIWNHRRYRQFADTPTCSVGAAPQGYVRLVGIGRPPAGTPLLSPTMHGFGPLPCLWYRIKVEECDSDNQWHTVFEESSDDAFMLVDDDGNACAVYPADATVITGRAETHGDSRERRSLWLLVAGTELTISGYFQTDSVHGKAADMNRRVRDKLADWKDSGETRRFDLDGNGTVDMNEWELARAAARREARAEHAAELERPASHSVSKPSDGRPFIISDRRPDQVVRRMRWQAWGCLLLFFAGVAGLAWTFGAAA